MIFEDDETLQMYVEESLEHLADIENNLLAIEESGADINEELVNDVFRAAHSIKGGAGFMGLTNIKKLSHKIESILGMIRNREIVPRPEVINVLLHGFDKLRDLINNNNIAESNDADIAEHIEALVGLTTASLPDESKESVFRMVNIHLADGSIIFQIPQFDMDQVRKDGKVIYLVEYDLIHDIQRKNKTPMETISILVKSGIIMESKVDIASVGTLDSEISPAAGIPFYILFASTIELNIIGSLFDVEDNKIHVITDDDISLATEQIPVTTVKTETIEPEHVEGPIETEIETISSSEPVKTIEPITTSEDDFTQEAQNEQTCDEPLDDEFEQQVSSLNKDVKTKAQASLRVNLGLLDSLMTLAGEMVLSRNQLIQSLAADDTRALELSSQRIDIVTSELQETIMRTRMQAVSNVFNKFPRVVRDLSMELGKEIELTIEGKGVELDKTIIEAINDPLTHLVRNSVDHGIELPGERVRKGKTPTGKIDIRAYHEAGQVNIEIADDGKGLDGRQLAEFAIRQGLISEQQTELMSDKEKIALIFLPGFSMAKKVTDVSGRGVGMDVVKTNLDKLGGVVDIDSIVGEGTMIRIKLPLTLAIIPSQIILAGKERYAIPQANLNELLRIPAAQVKDRIEKVGGAEIVRLRGNLLPLLNLSKILEETGFYYREDGNTQYPEKRKMIVDRRSRHSPLFVEDDRDTSAGDDEKWEERRTGEDRRQSMASAVNIAVVSTGIFKYGLVVDQLCDSEEIVVKPLGRHLKRCQGYAGATIMGDGKVALIIDVSGLALMAELTSLEGSDRLGEAAHQVSEVKKAEKDKASLLLFQNTEDEQFAVPLSLVERIERIKTADIEVVGGKKVIQYRGGTLPLYSLDQVAEVKSLPERNQLEVIVFTLGGREIGLMVTPPVDAVDVSVHVDTSTLRQTGIMGSTIINDKTTLMVDMFEIIRTLNPEWFDGVEEVDKLIKDDRVTVLFAEDSDFFRNQVKGFLQDGGYNVLENTDGQEAWECLEKHSDKVDIVLTDLEMPNMDGFQLTEKIKGDARFSHLHVIALTSLAGDEHMAKGKKVGIDAYQVKLDRDKLLDGIRLSLGR